MGNKQDQAQPKSTAYAPAEVENRIYGQWIEAAYFHGNPASRRKPYAIVIPPPNVTDILHLGHALNNTIQDILVRRHRMPGVTRHGDRARKS